MALLDSFGVEPDGRDGTVRRLAGGLPGGLCHRRNDSEDLLNREFPTLRDTISFDTIYQNKMGAYRQHAQQGGLAGILQADHGDIHLRRPAGKGD